MSLRSSTPAAAFLALATACTAPAPPPSVEGDDDSPESTPTPYETGPWPDRFLAGDTYSRCAVNVEGEIVCWGSDVLGGTRPPEGLWRGITASSRFYCGIRQAGDGECWGPTGGLMPPAGPSSEAVQVEADGWTVCWLLVDGLLDCNASPDGETPLQIAEWTEALDGVGPFVDIGLSTYGLIGVTADGGVALFDSPFYPPEEQDHSHPRWEPGLLEASGAFGLTRAGTIDYWNDLEETWNVPGQGFAHLFTEAGSYCGMYADQSVSCRDWVRYAKPGCEDGSEEAQPCYECEVPPGPWVDISYDCPIGCGIRPDWRIECWGCDQVVWGENYHGYCDPPQFPFKWQPTRQLLDSSLGQ